MLLIKLICFLLLSLILPQLRARNATAKQEVTIGLVYQSYAPSKVYEKAFREAIRNVNSGLSISNLRQVAARYTLKPLSCVLPRGVFHPSHVLHCLCDVLLPARVSVLVYLSAQEEFDESTSSSQYFLKMAAQSAIPIVAFNPDNAGYSFSKNPSALRIVQLAPSIEQEVQAMLSLLRRYHWSRFGVVCSKMAGSLTFLKTIESEIQAFEDRSFKLEIVHHEEVDDDIGREHIHRALSALKNSEARIILLYSTAARTRRLFEVAAELQLLSAAYLWVGVQSVKGALTSTLPPTQHGMLAVAFHTVSHSMFPPADDVITNQIGNAVKLFATALSHLSVNQTVGLASNATCGGDSVDSGWELGQRLYDKMKSSFFKGNPGHVNDGHDSFFYLFDSNGKLRTSALTIANLRSRRNKTARESPNFWDKVGEFTNGELRMLDIEWPANRTSPPEGTPEKFHLKVVTLEEAPFVIVGELEPESGRCPGNQGVICDWGTENTTVMKCCTGFCIDLLNKLSVDVGFTFALYRVVDKRWGIKTGNRWNGLIQDLVSRKADLAVTSLKLNSERARDIDFTVPFLETGIGLIVKIRSGVLSPTAFLEPFDLSVWLVIFLAIQLAALSIFFFEFVSPRSFNCNRFPPPGHRFSILRSYWLVSTDVPLSAVARSLSLVWSAFSLTFLAVYTANLAAFMITRHQFHSLTGIDDPRIVEAADQTPPFRIGTVENGNTHETMKRNWHSLHSYVYNNNFFTPNISAGIDALRNDQFDAFVYDAVVLDYQASKASNCEFVTVGQWSAITGYAFGLPKNSPHLAKIDHFMLNYQKRGDFERLTSYWLTGSCIRDSNEINSSPLGIDNFTSAFILLLSGIAVAVLCLGLEHVYCAHLRQFLQRVDPNGWIALLSTSMGKSVSFTEAVQRVKEWRVRAQSLSASVFGSPFVKRVSWSDIHAVGGASKPNGEERRPPPNARPKSIIRRKPPQH